MIEPQEVRQEVGDMSETDRMPFHSTGRKALAAMAYEDTINLFSGITGSQKG